MELKGYGTWKAAELVKFLTFVNPFGGNSAGNFSDHVQNFKADGRYDSFVVALRELLLDESLTLSEKSEHYLDYYMRPRKAYQYFKWIWQNMVPDQPWPLEGKFPEFLIASHSDISQVIDTLRKKGIDLKGYGTWPAERFVGYFRTRGAFDFRYERVIESDLEILKTSGFLDSLVEAFKEFLLDDSMTPSEKMEYYLDYSRPPKKAYAYLKWIWQNLAPGKPWPLEGKFPELDDPKSGK